VRVILDGVANYKCDWCRRNFTAEQAPHLALPIGKRAGTVGPRNLLPGWRFRRMIKPDIYHFCIEPETTCLDKWIRTVLYGMPPPVEYVEGQP